MCYNCVEDPRRYDSCAGVHQYGRPADKSELFGIGILDFRGSDRIGRDNRPHRLEIEVVQIDPEP